MFGHRHFVDPFDFFENLDPKLKEKFKPWIVGWVKVEVEDCLHAVVVVVELLHQTNPLLLAGVPGQQ